MKCRYCNLVNNDLDEGKGSVFICANCLLTKKELVIKDFPETKVDLYKDYSGFTMDDFRSTEFDNVDDEMNAYAIAQSNKE